MSAKVLTPKVVFIRSVDEKIDVDQINEVVKKSVRHGKMGINVKRVIKTARGLMIETDGQKQLEKLKSCAQLADKGLVFDEPKKRQPRLMIYDVESPENHEDLVEEIYDQNISDKGIDLSTFQNEFQLVHTYKKKNLGDSRVTVVAECTARVRNLVRARDRLYIRWQSCRVKDYNPLVRCYKCQAFGHVAKYCRGKSMCPHCPKITI